MTIIIIVKSTIVKIIIIIIAITIIIIKIIIMQYINLNNTIILKTANSRCLMLSMVKHIKPTPVVQ